MKYIDNRSITALSWSTFWTSFLRPSSALADLRGCHYASTRSSIWPVPPSDMQRRHLRARHSRSGHHQARGSSQWMGKLASFVLHSCYTFVACFDQRGSQRAYLASTFSSPQAPLSTDRSCLIAGWEDWTRLGRTSPFHRTRGASKRSFPPTLCVAPIHPCSCPLKQQSLAGLYSPGPLACGCHLFGPVWLSLRQMSG